MKIRSVEQLTEAIQNGYTPRFVFFWGHKGPESSKGSFSQWYPASFEADGVSYSSAEQFMMAEKARLFRDDLMLEEILDAETPAKAKALGRTVLNFDPETWNAHRFEIVVRGNVAKFDQNILMRNALLKHQWNILVEASPRDRIWGIGMGAANPNASDPTAWRGLNLLGFALMEARDQLLGGS
jgi:ribA/ribD-fused uncharacterized protein